MKDCWDKAQSLATIVSLLAVPTVLAWGSWRIQERIAEQSTKREYVQIAVGILNQSQQPVTPDERAMRGWAVNILELHAPVKLTKEAREKLLNSGLAPTSPATVEVR